MLSTTFALLHAAEACREGYEKLARALGGIRAYGRNTPIPLAWIIETNDLETALWCLRAVLPEQETERDKIARLFAADCAERMLPLYEARHPGDQRPHGAIDVARRYAWGEATDRELAAAHAAAWVSLQSFTGVAPVLAYQATAEAAAEAAFETAEAAFEGAFGVAYAGAVGVAAPRARFRAAAEAAEGAWQTARFLAYIRGEV